MLDEGDEGVKHRMNIEVKSRKASTYIIFPCSGFGGVVWWSFIEDGAVESTVRDSMILTGYL